jgi:hypothetical protein
MHTLQRDMTVPPSSFLIQVAQHYRAATPTPLVPFLWQIYTSVFFWPFFSSIPLSSSYYQHFFFLFITFIFFYFRGGGGGGGVLVLDGNYTLTPPTHDPSLHVQLFSMPDLSKLSRL